MKKLFATLALLIGFSVPATAYADTTVNVPGIGSFNYGNSGGTTLNNYAYNFGSKTVAGTYNLSSSGTPNGWYGSNQTYTSPDGSFSGTVKQDYGVVCMFCDSRSFTSPLGTVSSSSGINNNGQWYQNVTTPLGSVSWPPK
jgi:hypothetical protein